VALTPGQRRPADASADIGQRWIADVMDLCLSCKACKTECPANVDVAKLKAEFTHAYYADRRRPLGHLLVKNIDLLSPVGAAFAGPANWAARRPFVRGIMEALAGIDRRRSLPELHRDHLRRWFRRRPRGAGVNRVVLLDDCFTTFQEPHIGRAAVELLERLGFTVELAGVCCGRAMISKGFLTAARDEAKKGIRRLAKFAAEGVPVLGLEPSCVLTLADEWPELVPGPASGRVAAVAELAEAWIARQVTDNGLSPPDAPRPGPGPAVLHPHCHQRALVGAESSANALRLVPGLSLSVLDAGCCGMAGAFGYEKDHYDISVKIAGQGILPALAAAPAAEVIAPGTSCRHQIRDLTGRVAKHPVEVLHRAWVES
jgi:Fe-S oxidoreductase